MLSIKITLFLTKSSARNFALGVLAIGLILRGLAAENSRRKKAEAAAFAAATAGQTAFIANPNPILAPLATLPAQEHEVSGPPMLCAIRGVGKTLNFAVEEAIQSDRPLYVLFVLQAPILLEDDAKRRWQEDPEAKAIFLEARKKAGTHPLFPCYAVSDSVAHTVVDFAATMGLRCSCWVRTIPQQCSFKRDFFF